MKGKTRTDLVIHLEHSLDMPWYAPTCEQQDHIFDVLGLVAFSLDSHGAAYWEPYAGEIRNLTEQICLAMMAYENEQITNLKNTLIEVQDKLADIAIRMNNSHEDMPAAFMPAYWLVRPIIDSEEADERDVQHQQKKVQIMIVQQQLHNGINDIADAFQSLLGS